MLSTPTKSYQLRMAVGMCAVGSGSAGTFGGLGRALSVAAFVLAMASASGRVAAADALPADAMAQDLSQEQAAAALQQLRAQEQQLQVLRQANEQQQQTLAKMQSRLSTAESVASWLPWLALALVASGALSVWLALRARKLQSDSEAGGRAGRQARGGGVTAGHGGRAGADSSWRSSAGGQTTSAGLAPMVMPSRPVEPITVVHAPEPAAPPTAAAAPLPAPRAVQAERRSGPGFSLGTGVPPREVSVEELLDLEQQVDFFVVLGQDENAIDLLVSHIRATGGTSALPYLKLMEIYHRQGNAEDYERTRSRFNKRFSAKAPAWGGDPALGRALDDYGDVVELLQLLWPMPRRAQREIETLMHPNDRELVFDLPAFHDLLTLHAVIGDLLGHPEPLHPNDVDIMLPLSDEQHDSTTPQPHVASRPMPLTPTAMLARMGAWPPMEGSEFGRDAPREPSRTAARDPGREAEHTTPAYASTPMPTSPPPGKLDLDLSDYAPAPREFTEPAAFTDIRLFRDGQSSDFAPMGGPEGGPAGPRRGG